MPTRKLVGAAAFSAALAAGGVAGALFGTPVLSGAQEDSSSTTTPPTADAGEEPKVRGPKVELEAAADALGMTVEELRTELAAGTSIAGVAEAKGVDKQTVIDAMVAAATERLDEMKVELPARIAELVEREGLGRHGHRHGPGPRPGVRFGAFNAFDDAATALGIARQELVDELASGKSIAQVASERGKSLDDVKAAMIADATARIDEALADGRIDAARAEELKAGLAEKIDAAVQREGLPERRGRLGRGPAD